MAKIVRYGGNLKAFASEQQTNERTLFGQVTIANDLTSQVTAQFLRGWGIVGPSDQPSLQDFNAAMYTHGQLLAYLHQMGLAEYNAAQEYFIGSLTQTGGVLYMSLTNANIGNAPSSSPANWKAFSADQATEVALGLVKIATQTQTNNGLDDSTAVTPKKLAVTVQSQAYLAVTTTGTGTAYAIAPNYDAAPYAANQRFYITFHASSGANPTLNASGRGARPLRRYNASGAKVAAVLVAGQMSDVVYDGTDFVVLDQLPPNISQDLWAMQPVGAFIGLLDGNSIVQSPPRDNPAYRYIRLTASDPYNTGVMTSESVSGVAPLVVATGVVSFAGSPLSGLTVSLINTERRYIRAGAPGVVEQDAMQGHYHNIVAGTTAGTGLVAGTATGGTGIINNIVPGGGRVQSPATDGTNGAVRTANETRAKSIGATYYMRIV